MLKISGDMDDFTGFVADLFLRVCSRPLRATVSCVWTEYRNRSLHGVNENFELRSSATGSGAVDIEQVLTTTPSFAHELWLCSPYWAS